MSRRKQYLVIPVYNQRCERIANTTAVKARKLMKSGKAKPCCYTPFSIRMLVATGENGKNVLQRTDKD